MLAKILLRLKNTTDKKITTNMSSVFQGILMEFLKTEFATKLHIQQRQPYSQYIRYENDIIYWTISTVTKEAYEEIILPLCDSNLTQLYSKYHDMTLKIEDKQVEMISEQEFLKQEYFRDFSRTFEITFLTPTSFKSNGQYMNYPTIRWLFQSLMNKYDSKAGSDQIFDEDVLRIIEEEVSVTQYKLKSTLFHLEGTKVPSFVGNIKLYAKSNQSIVNLIHYLLKYGEYSGVGIKTAIGMGAICVKSKERNILEWTKEE